MEHLTHLEAPFVLWLASVIFVLLVALYQWLKERRRK